MINKEQILLELKKYKLDSNRIIIISGAAMVLRDVKETTRDIDLYVDKSYYDYLVSNYNCKYEGTNEFNHDFYYIGKYINFGMDYRPDEFDYIDGYKVQSLNSIIKLKEYLNREKDFKDIELIKKKIKEGE